MQPSIIFRGYSIMRDGSRRITKKDMGKMAKRIALLNNKGGVGKTFATVALAEAAARLGATVLVVDLDPQANATRRLGVSTPDTLTGCLELGVQRGAAAAYRQRTGWDAGLVIDVLAADFGLEDRALEAGQPGAYQRLRKALFGVDDGYDVTLIDCPPSLGHLTTMGIAALDGVDDTVLVPLELDYDAITGARRAIRFIEMYREDLSVGNVEVAGLIVNKRRGTSLQDVRVDDLATSLTPPVLTVVPLRAKVAELQDAGQPLNSEPDLRPIVEQFAELVKTLKLGASS